MNNVTHSPVSSYERGIQFGNTLKAKSSAATSFALGTSKVVGAATADTAKNVFAFVCGTVRALRS